MKVLSFLIFAAVLVQGYALQCYQCQNCTTPTSLGTCESPPPTTTEVPGIPTTTASKPTTTVTLPAFTSEDPVNTESTTETQPSTTNEGSASPSSTTENSSTTNENTTPTDSPAGELNPEDEAPLSTNFKLYRPVRSARDTENEETYQCFVLKKQENGNEVIDRGCISNAALCKMEEGCTLCNTDKCNGSEILSSSMLTLVTMLGLSLYYFK